MGKNVTDITHAAINRLMKHSWPGNVRELENAIERAVAMAGGDRIDEENLYDVLEPAGTPRSTMVDSLIDLPLPERLAELEKNYYSELLRHVDGRTDLAAEKAGQSLRTLQRKLKSFGIRPEDFKAS